MNKKKEVPWNKWVTMDHAPDNENGSKLFFRVAMHACPPEEDKEETWCQRKDLIKDEAQPLIDMCIQDHANCPPCLDPLVSRQKTKQEVQAPAKLVDRSSSCDHGNFQVSFKMEEHPGFCLPRHHLHGLRRGRPGCERTFVPNLKEERRLGKDKASRPASNVPVRCCENVKKGVGACRQHECKHALCDPCVTEAALGDKKNAVVRMLKKGWVLAGSTSASMLCVTLARLRLRWETRRMEMERHQGEQEESGAGCVRGWGGGAMMRMHAMNVWLFSGAIWKNTTLFRGISTTMTKWFPARFCCRLFESWDRAARLCEWLVF
jgi:hypothetical protein